MNNLIKIKTALHSALSRNESFKDFNFNVATDEQKREALGQIFTPELLTSHEFTFGPLIIMVIERAAAETAIQQKRDQWPAFGNPTSDFHIGHDRERKGYVRHFEHGSIYYLPGMGAYVTYGYIRDKYLSLGAEASYLGYPISDEIKTPSGEKYSNFEHEIIWWSQAQGAYIITSLDVHKERHQLGAYLYMNGWGFTPGGRVNFAMRNLPGAAGEKSMTSTHALADGRFIKVFWDGQFWGPGIGGSSDVVAYDVATGREATYNISPALY
jgi:LGFP repeat